MDPIQEEVDSNGIAMSRVMSSGSGGAIEINVRNSKVHLRHSNMASLHSVQSYTSMTSMRNTATSTSYTAPMPEGEGELIITKRVSESKVLPEGTVIEKPWLDDKAYKKLRRFNHIFLGAFILGLGIVAAQVYVAYTSITNHNYCEVLIDNFDTFNTSVWKREVQIGGYGNGEFDWTTESERNSYVENGKLYIVPTLTNETISNAEILNGYTVNLTADGTCTGSGESQCWILSNSTTGVILPPVQSARLNTKLSASLKYGKIEVRAKMPKGDWLWPAIWMLPVDEVYGAWPASGEIDIAESRGNGMTYPSGGYDQIRSTLHWGPSTSLDGYLKTTKAYQRLLGGFADKFHTYGLEWDSKYIKTYVDGRLTQVLYRKFSETFWSLGEFSATYDNGTYITDPWPVNNNIAPFDQEFYLILNVAVGGTNGFFPDNEGNKPWSNTQTSAAPSSFWSSVATWYPSWGTKKNRALIVDSVKIYKICDEKSTLTKKKRWFF